MQEQIKILKHYIDKATQAGVYNLDEIHEILLAFAAMDAVYNLKQLNDSE